MFASDTNIGVYVHNKKVFDVVLAATRKDNGVEWLYTVNIDDFKDFPFLQIENPLS